MTTVAANVRFVTCPKCFTLLRESTDVPIYKCGGCSTILRAKHCSTSRESIYFNSFENKSRRLSDTDSFDHESTSVEKETRSCLSDGAEQVKPKNFHAPDSDAALNCEKDGESSNCVKDEIKESRSTDDMTSPALQLSSEIKENGSATGMACPPAHQVASEREKTCSPVQSPLGDSIHATRELVSDKEQGASLNLTEENKGIFRLSNTAEESNGISRQCVASEDDRGLDGHRHDSAMKSSNWKSTNAYNKDSVGSPDNVSSVKQKHLGLSRRTFRHKTAFSSGEGVVGNRDSAADAEALLPAREHLNAPNRSAVPGSCAPSPKRDESSFKPGSVAKIRYNSFESDDFQSAMSWMESEKGSLGRSSGCFVLQNEPLHHQNGVPSTKFHGDECDCVEVLKRVDSLRNHLNEFCDRVAKREVPSKLAGSRLGHVQSSSYNHKFEGLNSYNAHPPPRAKVPRNNVSLPGRCGASQMPFPGHPKCSCSHCNGLRRPSSLHSKRWDHPNTWDPPHDVNHSGHHSFRHNEYQINELELEKLRREGKRQPATKRHCLPVSGGAPFVLCSNCLRLLQLPADFLVSKKSWHKLQCGACSKALVFSYRAKAHGLPSTPEARHPNSEISASSSSVSAQRMPSSYNEEHRFSLVRDFSTEEEHSESASELREERRRRAAGSSLHQLMGYDSASDLLFRDGDGVF